MDYISIEENQTNLRQPSEISEENKNVLSNSHKRKKGFTKKSLNKKGGGIIYIGHIPHGFYEDEMKSYFNQFGKVVATTVSRSKKTGRSRGYGFVQFRNEEVAKIAAETMNNYLMFNRIIKCRYIPPEERKMKNIFENNISVHNYPRQKNRKIDLKNKKKAMSKLNQDAYLRKIQSKINKFKTYFEKNGINFTFKINNESEKDNSTNNESGRIEAKSSNLLEESENETDMNGVLEIDESENEISFETPPQVKKVIKKSLNSSVLPPSNSLSVKKVAKKIQKQKKSIKKSKVPLLKQAQGKKNCVKAKKIGKEKVLKKIINNKKVEKISSKKKAKTAARKNPERKVKKIRNLNTKAN